MILYHGSTVEIKLPRLLTSDTGRDFGRAFYTTDIKEQAQRWAKRRAVFSGNDSIPFLSIYNFAQSSAENTLKIKRFKQADNEWLDLIMRCRKNPSYQHGFDIVIGKVADDTVGATINMVLSGVMRKEDALERLRFQHINNQIAFCSDKALQYLNFIGSEIVNG